MLMKKIQSKTVAYVAIGAFTFATVPVVPVQAALVDNDRLVGAEQTLSDRDTVNAFIDRSDVRSQFEALGVDPEEAKERVAALSDEEVSQLAERINTDPAGQGAVGAIIGAALIIFLVLLITDILGFTNVFDFTEKGSANPSKG